MIGRRVRAVFSGLRLDRSPFRKNALRQWPAAEAVGRCVAGYRRRRTKGVVPTCGGTNSSVGDAGNIILRRGRFGRIFFDAGCGLTRLRGKVLRLDTARGRAVAEASMAHAGRVFGRADQVASARCALTMLPRPERSGRDRTATTLPSDQRFALRRIRQKSDRQFFQADGGPRCELWQPVAGAGGAAHAPRLVILAGPGEALFAFQAVLIGTYMPTPISFAIANGTDSLH